MGTGWARGKSDCTAEDAWQMGAHAFSLPACRGAEEAILRGKPMKQGAGAHAVGLKGCGGEEEAILRCSKLMKQGAGERTRSPTRQVERTISNRKTLNNSSFFFVLSSLTHQLHQKSQHTSDESQNVHRYPNPEPPQTSSRLPWGLIGDGDDNNKDSRLFRTRGRIRSREYS